MFLGVIEALSVYEHRDSPAGAVTLLDVVRAPHFSLFKKKSIFLSKPKSPAVQPQLNVQALIWLAGPSMSLFRYLDRRSA